MVGAIVGTLEYMAPEQARGQPVDQRADVYAFGLILYDILLGRRRAASGQSAVEELQRRMKSPPPPLQALEPDIPAPVAALVGRCVDPDADKRFQTSAEVAAELDRLHDAGQFIPVRKTVGLPQMAAIITVLTAVFGGAWWYFREPPVVTHDNISVLIADLDNQTGDPGFTGTLEPVIRRALEGAAFITSYDRYRLGSLEEKAPDRFDENAAHGVAVRRGIPVLLAGSIARQGANRFRISLKATQTVSGDEIATEEGTAAGEDDVVDVSTRLVGRIRKALGDDTEESSEQFAMGSLTATSLETVRLYAGALEAASDGRHEESLQKAQEAVASDPEFGIGYVVLASAARNLGRPGDSEKYIKEAMRHVDGMTERERMSTRGYSNWLAGDYQECRTQYATLVSRYPSDVGGHNQLALCNSHLRDMRKAMDEMKVVVKMVPNRVIFKANLALYSSYAGEFAAAEAVAREVAKPDEYLLIALAFSQIGRDRLAEARSTYERLAAVSPVGASYAASGLGDLAAYEGRYADAVAILRKGAAEDLAAKRVDRAAAKFAAIGFAEMSRGRPGPARDGAREALKLGSAVKIRVRAARTLAEAGDTKTARTLMEDLAKELSPEAQAHAKIIEGMLALKAGDARAAMSLFDAANMMFPTWIGQFELGRAALAAGALTKADSALDDALKRKGEGLSLFVDEEPTAAYVPLAYYYQGRVREEIPTAGFRNSYRQYVQVRGKSPDDALLPEARRRAQEP